MTETASEKSSDRKTALISGGTSGINLEIAKKLFARGDNVVVFGRSATKAESAAEEIINGRDGPNKVLGLSADVRSFDEVETIAKTTSGLFGSIDIVIAGAAGNFPLAAKDMSSKAIQTVVDIDLIGTFNLFKAAYPFCSRPGASLIAISAEQASVPHPYQLHVCAAKAGVEMIVKVLAMEWGVEGIRANTIVPGPIDDTEGMARLTPTAESRAALESMIPLKRYGTKDDIAELAAFLCSPAAKHISGSVIQCDGGAHLAGLAQRELVERAQ